MKQQIFHFLIHAAIAIFSVEYSAVSALSIEVHDTIGKRFEIEDWVFRFLGVGFVFLLKKLL